MEESFKAPLPSFCFQSPAATHIPPLVAGAATVRCQRSFFSQNWPLPVSPSLKKLPSSPHHPPPHPSPARLTPTIVDLFMTPTVTRLLPLKSLLPPARTNKQNGSRNLNQLYIPPVPPASAKLFTLGRFPYIPAESICTGLHFTIGRIRRICS